MARIDGAIFARQNPEHEANLTPRPALALPLTDEEIELLHRVPLRGDWRVARRWLLLRRHGSRHERHQEESCCPHVWCNSVPPNL
jgi:hypothetical protein